MSNPNFAYPEVGNASLTYIPSNGHSRDGSGNLYIGRQGNEVMAGEEDEDRINEIQEKVESGMTL
jgi:hypothetical protein